MGIPTREDVSTKSKVCNEGQPTSFTIHQQGKGSRIAKAYENQGTRLVLSGRNIENLVSLAKELKSTNYETVAVQADVKHPEQVEKMVTKPK